MTLLIETHNSLHVFFNLTTICDGGCGESAVGLEMVEMREIQW